MKTTLIIVGNYNEQGMIPEIKSNIVSYLGKRMIADECVDSPGLSLCSELSSEDVKYIANMIEASKSQSITVLLVENDSTPSSSFVNILTKKESI